MSGNEERQAGALTRDKLQKMLDHSPFIAFLGLGETLEADPAREQLTMTCAMRPELERGAGTGEWHGGRWRRSSTRSATTR